MKRELKMLVVVVGALFCFASAVIAQGEPQYVELPNFHQVNEQLYRGAQPKPGGIQRLVRLGIKTIVNLRGDDVRSRAEELEARAVGLRYFNVPFERFGIVSVKRLGRPTDEQVERVLSIINAPENHPVFVHCKRGADRTGTIIAIYRIEHDGWTSERAKAEAKRYGMAWWERGKKSYIGDYYRRRLKRTARVLAPSVIQYHRAA